MNKPLLILNAVLALLAATSGGAADSPAPAQPKQPVEPVRLLTAQQADGEFRGWRTFHETPGTRTGDVWRLASDGVLVCGGSPRGYLYTEQSYTNFNLQFEWRYPAGSTNSNGGALVRVTGEDAIWPKCLEFQLNLGQAGDFWAIRDYRVEGPAARVQTITNTPFGTLRHLKRLANLEKPPGEWNRFEGIVQGGSAIQKVNGTIANEAAGCEFVPGRIAFTSEGQEIHFRNVMLQVLP